jgi:tRNA(fMet)-specific endonuclease VapC
MSYLLDTDICSHHLKRGHALLHRFNQFGGRLYLSTVSLAELHVWSYRRNSAKHRILIAELVSSLHVLAFDEACAEMFGQIKFAAVAGNCHNQSHQQRWMR